MANAIPPEVLTAVPVSQIQPSQHKARKQFDQAALQALAESIKHEGLIEPVIVRQVLSSEFRVSSPSDTEGPQTENSIPEARNYELVSGERRWRAVQLLGWETIPARVTSIISEGSASAKALLANLQRVELDALEEAEAFLKLNRTDPEYWTWEMIAQVSGLSQSAIEKSLSLLGLPQAVQDEIRAGRLSRNQALEIVRLPSEDLQVKLTSQVADRRRAKETRTLVESILKGVGQLLSPIGR